MVEALTPAELSAYLARIGLAAPPAPDLAGLTALHRAHAAAIPFENLDVQFARPPGRDPQAIFAKLVEARRGGWCYEQNGLFARALAALGFAVTPLSAGVMREVRGEAVMGSHLALKVALDGSDWLADVGFGGVLFDPLPLRPHDWDQGVLAGTLERLEDGYWRLAVRRGPMPLSYDFLDRPGDQGQLDVQCSWLGSSPDSLFVQNLAVQRRSTDGHLMLRGKVLTETGPGGSTVRELASAAELAAVLRDRFALDLPQVISLWPRIEARHAELFGAGAT